MPRISKITTALTALLIALFVLNLCSGSIWVSPSEYFRALSGSQSEGLGSTLTLNLLYNLRLPKALTAILAGVALSVAGVLMQTLFRNPLAGPYILGVNSGASLGVALVTMLPAFLVASFWAVPVASLIGAAVVMLLMLAIARRGTSNVSLLIVGMMLGSVAGALVNVVQNMSNPDSLKVFIVWTFGSLGGVGWNELLIMSVVLSAAFVGVVFLLKPLNGFLLGVSYARALGVNIERARAGIVIVTSLLAGIVTAFCGPIAFVGVAVPHIARGLLHTTDHRYVIPVSMLLGANLLLVCDTVCNLFTYPLPISTMSALFGAPVIIAIILRNKQA